jgi:Uncharacterized conserved protein
MKSFSTLSKLLYLVLLIPFLASCDSEENNIVTPLVSTGIIVLNEGSWASNNSELTYYNYGDSTAYNSFFTSKNNRGLGDTGNDILRYGSKIYITVSGSNTIEVTDLKGNSITQIIGKDNDGNQEEPRSLASDSGKVYVTLFDGYVAKIDTATLKITAKVAVGPNPEGIAITNGKIYVANSGGMNWPNYDKTVSVIDEKSFTELKKINVEINPDKVKADSYGDIYVISNGDYYLTPYTFQRINSKVDTAVVIKDFNPYKFTISGDKAYCYYYSYGSKVKKFMVYDVKNEKVLTDNFITDGTSIATVPYSIDVNPANGDVYIGESDGSTTGKMNCFSSAGKFKFSFTTGINPKGVAFLTNK